LRPSGYVRTLFFDDFPGSSIDTSKWDNYTRRGDLANGEVNGVRASNITVANSIAAILCEHVPGGFTSTDAVEGSATVYYASGQLACKQLFKYGTVEVRAKMPGGVGLWPCIWALASGWQASQPTTANTPEHDWPNGIWGEVDFAEFANNIRDEVNCVIHFNTPGGSDFKALPFDADSRFMVYRCQWAAGSMIWSVDAEDGVGWRTLKTTSTNVPDVDMYLILHVAIGGIFGGTPDPDTFPQTMEIDWVRITP
jgi:beta-glucanase (GH16 family)